MTKSKGYTLRNKLSKKVKDALHEYPEFVQELLAARGVLTKKDAHTFFNPDYDEHMDNPFLIKDMGIAVERILKAIDEKEHIAIYSDFDADGIPGGALLHDFFKKVGHERFTNYIPHRDTEGYGFHEGAVDVLHKKGVTLIITVDVGITNSETVTHANARGIDVIVTDHHIPPKELPNAIAVINPQRVDETYSFKHFCGTGVAFKVVQAVLLAAREQKKEWVANIPVGWEKWLLDLVAIATVGDMVPLVDENRTLVHFGLRVLRKSRRPGISALCRKLRLNQSYITEDDIGFSIAPRINAASRMGSPETAFELLITSDVVVANERAKELDTLNNKRKGQVASIVRELKKRFEEDSDTAVLVAGNPKWNPALLGLAANSLVEAYGKTACIWGREGTGSIKGSCRGNGQVNVVEMFNEAGDVLEQFGGHAHAGGFSVSHEKMHTLGDSFNAAYKIVAQKTEEKEVFADAEVASETIGRIQKMLTQFSPFGMHNPKPIFVYKQVTVQAHRQFGQDDAHIELLLVEEEQRAPQRAIAFFKSLESFTRTVSVGATVDVLCTIELSRFAGKTQLELRIVDIV